MAGIVTATPTQTLSLRDNLIKSLGLIQKCGEGSRPATALNPAEVTLYDAQLAALKTALVAITG